MVGGFAMIEERFIAGEEFRGRANRGFEKAEKFH